MAAIAATLLILDGILRKNEEGVLVCVDMFAPSVRLSGLKREISKLIELFREDKRSGRPIVLHVMV